MTKLRLITAEEGIKLNILIRVGTILREERASSGKSILEVANQFAIKPVQLLKWEMGLDAIPAYLYRNIFIYYGPKSYEKAAMLDLELQLEKYYRAMETIKVQFKYRKIPAVVWATIDDVAEAA